MAHLIDQYGRKITDLRVSITDRCNFHCVYCHNEGQGPVKRIGEASDELSVADIRQIARIGCEFGITQIKLSGGEPLVRGDCEEIIEAITPYAAVSLVTNGSLLTRRAASLREAGLRRINVSLDSMDPTVFTEVRRGHIRPVLQGVHAALEVGIRPVKVNMVVFEETIDSIEGLLGFVRGHEGLVLQLIEYMPEIVGAPERAVDIGEVKRLLADRADAVEVRDMHHRRIYHLAGAQVEVVDPVENPEFCAHCERLRVTANGHLKGCLNRTDDLVLARGLDDDGLREAFRRVTAERMPYYPHYARLGREALPVAERGRPLPLVR